MLSCGRVVVALGVCEELRVAGICCVWRVLLREVAPTSTGAAQTLVRFGGRYVWTIFSGFGCPCLLACVSAIACETFL